MRFDEAKRSATHTLKTDPVVFEASFYERKKFEIRFNDRAYRVGDRLLLLETTYSGEEMKMGTKPLLYTGAWVLVRVTHILKGGSYGLAEGWVILSVSQEGAGFTRCQCQGDPQPLISLLQGDVFCEGCRFPMSGRAIFSCYCGGKYETDSPDSRPSPA